MRRTGALAQARWPGPVVAAGAYPERRVAGRLPPLPLRAHAARGAAWALAIGAAAGLALAARAVVRRT